MKCSSKNGNVESVLAVRDQDEVIIATSAGMVVRCPVEQIRTSGRAAQGVRLIRLREKDRVVSAASVVAQEEEETDAPEKKK